MHDHGLSYQQGDRENDLPRIPCSKVTLCSLKLTLLDLASMKLTPRLPGELVTYVLVLGDVKPQRVRNVAFRRILFSGCCQ